MFLYTKTGFVAVSQSVCIHLLACNVLNSSVWHAGRIISPKLCEVAAYGRSAHPNLSGRFMHRPKKKKKTQKNKSQTHLCSALHIQTLCCINFLEWPQVMKAAWCNCTNFMVRIAFICMCLLGINLKITREHVLTQRSLSLEALNSSVLFVKKVLFDFCILLFLKARYQTMGMFLLCAHWTISLLRNGPWNYSSIALSLKCSYCLCAQSCSLIIIHAMFSIACAAAPLLSSLKSSPGCGLSASVKISAQKTVHLFLWLLQCISGVLRGGSLQESKHLIECYCLIIILVKTFFILSSIC